MQRVLDVVRWAPPAAALVYIFVLVRRLPEIVGQLTWNPDYVSVMAIAESIAASGWPHRAVVIQMGYLWFDLSTVFLPYHKLVWEYAPTGLALVTLALLVWTAQRLAGGFAAILTAALGFGASSLVLSTQLAQSYHGATWFGTALLAAYLVWLLTTKRNRTVVLVVSVLTGLVTGFTTASDPLLVATGDAPLAAALLLAWRSRRNEVMRHHVAAALTMAVVAIVGASATVLAERLAGFGSSFPRGLTHFVTREHLMGNLNQLVSGIFQVAGMPPEGSAVGIVLGLLLVAGLLLVPLWLIRMVHSSTPAPLVALIGLWSFSLISIAAAFVLSDIPSDFLDTYARYLVSTFFVAIAAVPLWSSVKPSRSAIVAVPAALFILANAAAVDRDASTGAFEPNFSFALDAPMAFLQEHDLTRGYAAYAEASPMSVKSNFSLQVYPLSEWFFSAGDTCGPPPQGEICPYAYDSISDWYRGRPGPTFILVDPAVRDLNHPPPETVDQVAATYHVGRFTILVYADDVATHLGTTVRFTRPLI